MRVACLLVPDLPLWAELRVRPEWAGEPLVVTSGGDGRAQVIATSESARAAGVQSFATLAQARAACPGVRVRVASTVHEQAARDALLDAAFACAPRASAAEPASGVFASEAAVFVDAGGVSSLHRSEASFATALAARSRALGLPGCVAIAGSRTVSRIAARALARRGETDAVHVIEPGGERRFLSPLPLDLLDPDDRVGEALTRFGVRRVGDLWRLPRRATAHRLGPAWLDLVARAGGEESEPPLPEPADTAVREAVDLDHAVDRLEPLRFVLKGLLSRALERLGGRGHAASAVELELGLDGGGRDARRIAPAAPTADARVWLRLLALDLEARPPPAPVERVGISARGAPPRRDQLDLFRPSGPDPGALDPTLAELEAWCGPGRVGAPQLADDHRPGTFALADFGAPPRSRTHEPPSPCAPCPVRALRPPVPARVRLRGGRPDWVDSAVARGSVEEVSGPWRTTGRWWSDDRFALDHYDVQVDDGTVVRLVYDFVERRWQIDAIYD